MTAPPVLRSWAHHLPRGTSPDGLDLVAGRSLPAAWRGRWEAEPRQVVLVGPDGATVRAGELDDRSAQAARRLAAAGVAPGDRVVVSAEASVDHVVAYVALHRLGAVVVPVNGAYREREVAQLVADAAPVAAITDDATRAGWVATHAPGPCLATSPDLSGLPGPGSRAGREGVDVALDRTGPDDPALLCYTSGTTGVPKGVLLTHGNLLASAEAVRLAWRWEPDDRLVLCLPLFHMHGLGVGLHGTLVAGAGAVLQPGFEPGAVVEAVREGATLAFGVPTMWHRLAAHPAAGDLRALRLAVSGSAPLPADLHAAVAAAVGQAPLERYGMTETVMLVSNPYDGERRPGSVGFPLPGVEARLVLAAGGGAGDGPGGADGAEGAGGAAGPRGPGDGDDAAAEIEVRGPNVFSGYRNRPDATAEAFRDGWFRTGDLGVADDDGYLRIVGRAKELIISGGYNVYPREVEDVLRLHPAVEDAAVVGAPDAEWGERVCAFVVPADDVADDVLAAWCAERLAPYKRPRRWLRVDRLPRNALGKVVRAELSARL